MNIIFVYRFIADDILSAYFVDHRDGVTVVRNFNGEVGSVVSSVPAERMAEIEAHIEAHIPASLEVPE